MKKKLIARISRMGFLGPAITHEPPTINQQPPPFGDMFSLSRGRGL
ncbi:MAG: hypothetical protein PHI93_08245 [Kiritimatiellae bacterium]|nr:hypothetical protein [Kiritimatiellia bacterium]